MKHLVFFFALQSAYPQIQSQFDFKARALWYARRTFTDPVRHVQLAGEVTLDSFFLGGNKKWGGGAPGWGSELTAVYGQRVVANTTELFAGQLIGGDVRYRSSGRCGLINRSLYASSRAFTARTSSGKVRPAYSRFIAVATGILVANQWRERPRAGNNLALAVTFGITDKVQSVLLEEFSPDLKKFGAKLWKKVRGRKP